jgi:hypothetical protein
LFAWLLPLPAAPAAVPLPRGAAATAEIRDDIIFVATDVTVWLVLSKLILLCLVPAD